VAVPAIYRIHALLGVACVDTVGAAPGGDTVVALAREDFVVAFCGVDYVAAFAATDEVGSPVSEETVCALPSRDHVPRSLAF